MALFRTDKSLVPIFGEQSSCKRLLLTNISGDNVTTYTSGAGSGVTRGPFRTRTNSGTDAAGHAGLRMRDLFANFMPPGNDLLAVNFGYNFTIAIQFSSINNSRNGPSRFYLGGTTSYTVGDNTRKSIGFRVLDETIYAAFHDGTTYSEPASTSANLVNSTTITNTTIHIENLGNGTVIWYANGVQFASTTSGPTGITSNTEGTILLSGASGGVGLTNAYLDVGYLYLQSNQ
jgi:hypothetical protein